MVIFLPVVRGRRHLLAVPMAGLLALVLWGSGGTLRVYTGEAQLLAAQKSAGFVRVGRFGVARWPAIVVEQENGDGGVSFYDGAGQAHAYHGFDGPMRALRLKPLRVNGQIQDFVQVFAARPKARDPLL